MIMKQIIFTFFLITIFSGLFGQIVNEDFESYTTGNGVAIEAGAPWTTWSGTTGGSEDPVISETIANGGIKSVYVSGTNDGVLELGDLTSGRYRIDFYLNIESGKIGYFNVLQDFDGSNSLWGTQLFFLVDGTGSIDAGGGSSATFAYTPGTWMPVRIFVDIDNDFATVILNGEELVSWPWSIGAFGGNDLNQLGAMNFYAWAEGGSAGYYFDDITVNTLSTLDAPQNLAAALTDDDISLSWDEPTSGTPDSYILVRNGQELASGLTGTTYDDLSLYPGLYTYTVKAFYSDEGYSPSSNEASETLVGGVAKDLVVYEIGTGTWCQYCPGAAMGADEMVENGHNVAIIEYHQGDNYVNTDATGRLDYYGITSFPTSKIDGSQTYAGGSETVSLYPTYLNFYNTRIERPSVYSLGMNVTRTDGDNYNVDINVTEEYAYFTGDVKLHVALTESHIPESWYGMPEVNFFCFEMLPNYNGVVLDFSGNTTQNINYDFSVNSGTHVLNNCEVVVFVQDNVSKEIVNAVKFDMEYFSIGVEDNTAQSISIYPNPAKDQITIQAANVSNVIIHDVSGKIIYSESMNNKLTINTSNFDGGVYFVKINDGKELITRKFVIVR